MAIPTMEDRFIVRLFACLVAFIIAVGFLLYCWALVTGRTAIPQNVVLATTSSVVAIILAATPWFTSRLTRAHISELIKQSDERTDMRIAQSENKLLNGTGDSIAERSADRVIDKQQQQATNQTTATLANTAAVLASTAQRQASVSIAATVENTAATMLNSELLQDNTRELEQHHE